MEAEDLDPASFEWAAFSDGMYAGERLQHQPTESYFQYYLGSTSLWTSFGPAIDSVRATSVHDDAALTQMILGWLRVVSREHKAPDLWQMVRGERALIFGDVVDGEDYFSAPEQRLLAQRIDQLEAQIKALAPHASQDDVAHTHEAFEHAKEASTRVSRVDWKSLFVGKLFDVIVRLGLEPQTAHQVFQYATVYIGPLISRIQGLLS